MINITSENGCWFLVRALIDQCSQASFVSEYLYKKLGSRCLPTKLPITGVGGKNNFTCKKSIQINVAPHFYSDFSLDVIANVIPKITSYTTAADVASNSSYLTHLTLADPHFNTDDKIEVLLDSSVHASIIEEGIRRDEPNEPIATKTKLGWVLSGNCGIGSTCCSIKVDSDTADLLFDLETFWKQEELFDHSSLLLSPDEQECEDFFVQTHSRDKIGRYIVRLPFKVSNPHDLKFTGSFNVAKNVLTRTEARFSKDAIYQRAYIKFMKNYEDTGHMKVSKFVDMIKCYFLPHHGFVKKHSINPENPKFRFQWLR